MRTTLDIDEDVLIAIKELAKVEHTTAGDIISRLARERLSPGKPSDDKGFVIKNGLPVFPSRGDIITNELVNRIRDEEGI